MEYKGLYVNLSSVNPGVVKKTINISKALNSFDCVTFSLMEPGFKLNHEVVDEHGLKKLNYQFIHLLRFNIYFKNQCLNIFPLVLLDLGCLKRCF